MKSTANIALPKVLLLTQHPLVLHKRNMNVYQRAYYGSRYARIRLIVRRNNEVSDELMASCDVWRAPVHNRWLFLLYCIFVAFISRFQGWSRILTEPSGFAGVGFIAKYFAGYCWAMDVWDRPRWRTGQHESGDQLKFSDRMTFWIMRHADIYMLSVLPPAAKDMSPPPVKCVQLFNAIDQGISAARAPQRVSGSKEPFRLAYARSKFWGNMGLTTLIGAAEVVKDRGVPVVFHLVGEVPPEEKRKLDNSRARDLFQLEGFVAKSRAEFFGTMHAGLVPYEDFEDLRYIFPIKVLEHLGQGNPVIGSRLPGIEFMVQDGFNGVLVEAGNSPALAEAVLRLAQDIELCNRLGRNALESSRRFDPARKNELIFQAMNRRSAQPVAAARTTAIEASMESPARP